MRKISFFKPLLFVAGIVLLNSCDKEFSVVGEDLLGENHFNIDSLTSSVVAYNQKITPVQSNNLVINTLGIYDDPAFGKTEANFASQVSLAQENPTIGVAAIIDSVYLSIPYFSTRISTDATGNSKYELDSIYGSPEAKIKLSVYESGFFMRDLDPNEQLQKAQKYYTNQNADFDAVKVGASLNDDASKAQNEEFFFDPKEIIETALDAEGKKVISRSAPQMRLKLSANVFQDKIFGPLAAGKLANNNVFREYFRGLYFKVNAAPGYSGNMAMMNFAKGKITISYKEDLASTTGGATTRVSKTITLNMIGNTVGLLEQSNTNTLYADATANPNRESGDDKLYVKGGEGSMGIIELFKTLGELETLRNNGWLVNEANLVFHIDEPAMATSYEPKRIYLYDLNNNRPVVDYYFDGTTAINAKNSKFIYGGIIKNTPAGKGLTYKFRITNQIKNLLKYKDSTNVKLGLVVTEDINNSTSYYLKTPDTFISQAPKMSVASPLGTILYGGGTSVPVDKRLKLEIYYTKPN